MPLPSSQLAPLSVVPPGVAAAAPTCAAALTAPDALALHADGW
jgi:hypothetical protein